MDKAALALAINGLKPGDTISFSTEPRGRGGEAITVSTVLLRKVGGEFTLSTLSETLTPRVSQYGPFRFDEEEGIFVDSQGDVYKDVQFERAAGL